MPVKPSPKSPLTIAQAGSLSSIPWLLHGFSTRLGGVSAAYGGRALNLGFTKRDSRPAVQRNRTAFLEKLGAAPNGQPWPLVTLRQIHSDVIHCIGESADKDGRDARASINERSSASLAGDGLITSTPGIMLGILTADCLPVILVDVKRRAIGVFHAGWRGTLQRIVEKGVGEMRRCFGTQARDLKAAIGPGIHGCCYEVGHEVRQKFESQFAYAGELFREVKEADPVREKYPLLFLTARAPGHSELPRKIFLDLVEANRRQLLAVGVPAKNIAASPLCTSCQTDLLFSHRAEKGITGRMMAAVGIRTPERKAKLRMRSR